MQHFQFQTVGNIISGLGSISELKTVLTKKNYKRRTYALSFIDSLGFVAQRFERQSTPN